MVAFPVVSQSVDLQLDVAFSITRDSAGLTSHRFNGQTQVNLSFAVAGMTVDINETINAVSSSTRLAGLAELRSAVAILPSGTVKDALAHALDQADAAIAAIRDASAAISIDTLYGQMNIIEDQLDDNFIDVMEDNMDPSAANTGRLLALAKPIEQRYDYLKYITNKVGLYANAAVKDQLAGLLRRTVLDQADGDRYAYCHDLEEILARVEEYRGTGIKEKAAGRIRYKADLLLRKCGVIGTERAWSADLATTIVGIDVDGTFTWDSDDYRAPSKDVCIRGLELTAGFAGEDWDASMDYHQEQRDYADRLEEDDDKITHSLDFALSWARDSRAVDVSISVVDVSYPNATHKQTYTIDIPVSLGFPVHGGDLIVDFDWESKTYPVDSLLDHAVFTGNLSYTKDQGAFTYSGYVKRKTLVYPNVPGKNRLVQEWEGQAEGMLSCGELTGTVFQQTKTYPSVPKKDQAIREYSLEFALDRSKVSITAGWDDKVTAYPNDASKPVSRKMSISLGAGWDVDHGTINASWSEEWNYIHSAHTTATEVLTKETHNVEVAWDGDITDDLTFSLSVE